MSGIKALSQHKFSPELNTREGITSTKTKHGVVWMGIALKSGWVMVCDKPSPLTGGAEGDGLPQNAESIENSSLRENFAHLTPKASPHSDIKASPIIKGAFSMDGMGEDGDRPETPKHDKNSISDGHEVNPSQKHNDPGFAKFKAGMAKRQCCLCGRSFSYDLTPYCGNGKRGYICATCHMQGPPPVPAKDDPQTKLEAGQ
jgi:hypothetical protein